MDLIFGYKQTGKDAVEAYNVFYYLTYPTNCDISDIDDEETRTAVLTQAAHFGQCPHPLFKSPHMKKRDSLTVPRHLRSVLLESNPSSLYTECSRSWIGKQCRIHHVSDFSSSQLTILHSVQDVLGDSAVNSSSSSEETESSESRVIDWPSDSTYPWTVMVDNCEITDMALVKVVLNVDEALSYNAKSHCFKVEVFTDDNIWQEVHYTNESIVRKEEGVVALISFTPELSRYWKVSILDIPFTSTCVQPSLYSVSSSSSTAGDLFSSSSSLKSKMKGPCIQQIDVMARKVFPHVPPKGYSLSSLSSPTQFSALW